MEAPWYKGRVVLIGDAVHATTPDMACKPGRKAAADRQIGNESYSLSYQDLRCDPADNGLPAGPDRR